MALGNYYLGHNGLTHDTLDRCAFKIIDDDDNLVDSYYFNVNPSNITASYPSRNIFNQTLDDVLMQGYGMGIHTIQIQGQTGFMKYAVQHRGPMGWGTGFQKAKRIKEIITRQMNNAHDDGTPRHMTTLYFCNYTDEVIYKVELDQNGLQFNQTNNDPLTYYYTISMVVIAAGNQPNPDEITLTNLGNWAVPGAYSSYSTLTYSNDSNPPAIDRSYMYRHSNNEDETNLQRAQDEVNKYENGRNSILDWENWKDQHTLEDKQSILNNMSGLSDAQKTSILNTIGNQTVNNPLVHVVYNGRRPFDIQLPNNTTDNTLQYWKDWIDKTKQQGTNDVGIDDTAPTGYDQSMNEFVRTQPNGTKYIYSDPSSTEPVAEITNQGAFYYLNGSQNDSSSSNINQNVIVDSNGHVINAPNGRNISYVIDYDLSCSSHVVALPPGNPADHFLGQSFLNQDIHHQVSTASFTWGESTSIPVNYLEYYQHHGSKGEWTCTTQVTGHGTIYWDGRGNITTTPTNTDNDQTYLDESPDLIINNYQIANKTNSKEAQPLNEADLTVPNPFEEEDEHPGNGSSDADSILPNQPETASINFVLNDGVVNAQEVDTIFDTYVKAYFAQNASRYTLNNTVTTPYFMNGTYVSASVKNDFNFDFQSDVDDNMPINVNGNTISLQSGFSGQAMPDVQSTDSGYWSAKGDNYITTQDDKINGTLDAYIRYWIGKNLSPSIVNQEMSKQAQMKDNTANQAVNESGQVVNGWYQPYNSNMMPTYDTGYQKFNPTYGRYDQVYGYYDRDGNIVYDSTHSNPNSMLIPTNINTVFTKENGATIIDNPTDEDTPSDEATNTNDIGNSTNVSQMNQYYTNHTNNVEHVSWQDGHLILNPYGHIIVPTDGTQVVGILLKGRIVPEVTYVQPPAETDIPVPDHLYGDSYIRAAMSDGKLVPDDNGNILVPANGNQIQEDNDGNTVITDVGSNTTGTGNTDVYRADAKNGNLYLDPAGSITVPTLDTRIEDVNGKQRIVGLDGSNQWIVCYNNIQGQLTPNPNGNIYVPRTEVNKKTGSNNQEIIVSVNGSNPTNPSTYVNNAVNVERASMDPLGNLYLNPRGSIYVPQNGTTITGKVINGVSEQVITDVGSNTTNPGPAIPDSVLPNAEDTEKASLMHGKLVLDPKGTIIVSKNGTMTQRDPQTGLMDIIGSGSNTTPVDQIPRNQTIDYGNSNFQYIQNANGMWVLVPKDGIQIVNRNGRNYVINTGSNTTATGPDTPDNLSGSSSGTSSSTTNLGPNTPNNLSGNALTISQMRVDHNGQIVIEPIGSTTNGTDNNPSNDSQYATDLTTIVDKNGKLVVVPNQYSTTDMGQPVPVNLAQNSTNYVKVSLSNDKVKLEPAKSSADNNPSHDYGLSSSYIVSDVDGKIKYTPTGSDTGDNDNNFVNDAGNATGTSNGTTENPDSPDNDAGNAISINSNTNDDSPSNDADNAAGISNGTTETTDSPNNNAKNATGTSDSTTDDTPSPSNDAKNATNWAQIKAVSNHIVITPVASNQHSIVGPKLGSHTEIQNNQFVIVPNTQSSLNTVYTKHDQENSVVIDDNQENSKDNSIPVNINGANDDSGNDTRVTPANPSSDPGIIQGQSSKKDIK